MNGSRWLLVLLAIAGLGLQAELWFSDDGYRKTLNLRTSVADQRDLTGKQESQGFHRVLLKRWLGMGGIAVVGLANQWPTLITYLDTSFVRMDNNLIENAIRPFAIGRKNWMFSVAPRGAESSALFYSLIETAKING